MRASVAGAALAAVLALTGCDVGPLGSTSLRGELASGPIEDWSPIGSRYALDIETRASSLLPAAHAWFVVQDGTLWLYAMSTDLEPPWLARLRDEDPGITVDVDGLLYPGRAVLVTDPAVLEPLLPRVLSKYHLVETPQARFVSHPERFPGTQIHHWFFRFEPASSGG